jgi:glycerate kinase
LKILIAADSFKDALDSFGVCDAIAKGLLRGDPTLDIQKFPLADGGEGSTEVLAFHIGGRIKQVQVHDPLMRKITASYLISADQSTAFIEMAKACGLELLTKEERTPMLTTTFGLGELILDAMTEGVREIFISIGGSATNDGGMGMAKALGYLFYDKHQNILDGKGCNLALVESVKVADRIKAQLSQITFTTLCDVNNPLYGNNGAAYVFAKQKGADDDEIAFLDQGLQHFAKIMDKKHLNNVKGAGAAGGLGYGTMVFLNATLHSGITQMMEMTRFEDEVKTADIIITGEGKIDNQTASGKLIKGIANMAAKYHKPVIALCGRLSATPEDVQNLGLKEVFPISKVEEPLDVMLQKTAINLEQTAFDLTSKLREYIVKK